MRSTSQEATPTGRDSSSGGGYRHDIDGLRTLAILLVVVYHVWLGRVSGGVDVFLMISAFFLTGSLVRRAEGGGTIALGAFWARRFGRLLPAAAVTLVGVLLLAFFLFPQTLWPRVWSETWASLFYVENWALAFGEVDYYARDAASTSPLQHFWSLSVQGQVFLIWPLLIALVVLILRRKRQLIRGALIVVFSVIFLASLAFSIQQTALQQEFAYFDTRTRLWEFAAGSLIALLLPFIRLPDIWRLVLGWGGVLAIVTCGLVLDVRGGFPGYLALWPVLGTAAVIVAGAQPLRGSASAVLSSRPLALFSRDAYALYLVHWPLLVTWIVVSGEPTPGILPGAGIILVSLLVARLLSRGVENPLRRWADRSRGVSRHVRSAVASVLVVAAIGGTWQLTEQERAQALMAAVEEAEQAAGDDTLLIDIAEDLLLPLPTALDQEWVSYGEVCPDTVNEQFPALEGTCSQTPDAADAERLVLVIGDSHAQQLGAPLVEIAEENEDLGVVALLKGGCTAGYAEESRSPTGESCESWIVAALDYADELSPDAAYVVVTRASAWNPERLLLGIDETIDRLQDSGIEVIAVRDNPRFSFDMYYCTWEEEESCEVPREEVLADRNPGLALGERVTELDFTPLFCPDDLCESKIGSVALYIDDNHLSWTFARTLVPPVQEALEDTGVLNSQSAFALPED